MNNITKALWLSSKSKVYNSNIWDIIVSDKRDYVYKVYNDKNFYDKELWIYNTLKDVDILIPKFEWLWLVGNYHVLKLENIRKYYIRKNNLKDLDLKQIAGILSKIHNFKKDWKNLILWDIHSSNFYEVNDWNDITLWIFDFSSSKYWSVEEDIANIFIDLWLKEDIFNLFLENYNLDIDFRKIYKFSIYELYERIKNWMNLSIEKKKMYYKFIIKLKDLYGSKEF
jgi:hypothetical protein